MVELFRVVIRSWWGGPPNESAMLYGKAGAEAFVAWLNDDKCGRCGGRAFARPATDEERAALVTFEEAVTREEP